ncbi:MAG TPA: FAD-dependent oxidoreductase, partial [Cytophagales bacterium]|nr:FAD-dependent oxidoreductase [Cytophagales bacterium]
LITNGPAELDEIQRQMLHDRGISIHEEQIDYISHHDGYVDGVVLKGGRKIHLKALFTKAPFEQHCSLPKDLGCEFTPGGLVKVDHHQKTTVEGVFAAGDNSHFFRGLSVAIGAGTIAAATINKELLDFSFETGGKKLVGTISV